MKMTLEYVLEIKDADKWKSFIDKADSQDLAMLLFPLKFAVDSDITIQSIIWREHEQN